MIKKMNFTTLLIVILCNISFAEKPPVLASTLSNATVYYGYGAELQHNAKANLINGSQEVTIGNLSHNIDQNTIQIA